MLKDQRAKKTLEKQLAKARKSSAPSMNTWTPRKQKEEEPTPPGIDELDIPAGDKSIMRQLVNQHASITRTQGILKKQKSTIVDSVKPLCKLYKLDKFMVGENRAIYYVTNRTSISKDLLLQAGVSPAIIKKCTVTKEVQQFKVYLPGVKSEGEEWD